MNTPALTRDRRRRGLPLIWALLGLALAAGCLPFRPPPGTDPARAAGARQAAAARSTATADIATFIIYPESSPTPAPPASSPPAGPTEPGLADTLTAYTLGPADDPTGAKTAALVTLYNFVNARGPYRGAWWFETDGQGQTDEMLAVIFYTEGSISLPVQKAVAARYLWYCGGQGEHCQGKALINFLAYFQAWREPWNVKGGFTNTAAKAYLALADDAVHQRGLVCDWIPGAEWFVPSPEALSEAGPVDWETTPFHFANVHLTWDQYLRSALGRSSDGLDRLWVLTVSEARQVCGSGFVCPDMTRPRP